jgi:2-polyprenyl-3-methyl-5-hydroxy-6-metoxy-1,4-benzoquinol methylase
VFKQAFGGISGGRVLDVATAEGGFIRILQESLSSYTEIVGIDVSRPHTEAARSTSAPGGGNVCFIQMNGERMGLKDGSFDTVTISASLHHLANGPRVLAEMKRALRPGGHLLVAEMHQDGRTEAQLTLIQMHHWVAAIDTALGILHNRTLARQEMVDLIADLDLCDARFHDWVDTASDPLDPEAIRRGEAAIERHIERARGTASYESLRQRGEDLRRRLRTGGVQREPVLIITAKKP